MSKARRKFSNEFKEEAVKLVLEQNYTIAEAAKNLGIRDNQLWRWKKEYLEIQTESSSISVKEELRQLRQENQRLKMERDILKKATAFFAKESQ